MDKGHEMTDALIKECERRVKKEYEQAYRETQRKLRQYWKDIEGQAAKKREQWQAGEISEKDYTDWLRRKAGMGKRWEDMRDNLAQDYYSYNQIARSIVKGYQPDAYALNHNFATYQIEHDGGIDTFYTLYDRQTVERLIREDQILMPEPSEQKKREIARNKDMQWNHQQLQSALTQGILQGETIPQLADRIANTVSVRNYNSSVRYARTMMTSAQNAGRYDGYRRAKRMGIDLTIEWSATLDGRTRHDHRMMHGQRREVDEPFETPDGFTILYPADCTGESDVPQNEIWNCRCTLLAWVKGFEGETVKSSPKMGNMTFEEWQNAKAPKNQTPVKVDYGEAINRIRNPYKNQVMAVIDNAPNDVKRAWNKCSPQMMKPEYDLSSGAHFSRFDRRTHFASQKEAFAASSYQEAFVTYFHEYGHNIDYLLGDGTTYLSGKFKNGAFGNTIYEECHARVREFWYNKKGYKGEYDALMAIQNGSGGMGGNLFIRQALRQVMPSDEYRALRSSLLDGGDPAHKAAFEKYLSGSKYIKETIDSFMASDKDIGKEFCKHIKQNMTMYERSDISDMFERYMIKNYGTKYPFDVGHGVDYWYVDDNERLGREAFAEMFSAKATNNKSLGIIKQMFPESYKLFEEMLKEGVK